MHKQVKQIIVLVGLLLFSPISLAHAPIEGLGYFYNGLLHPLLVPPHLLVFVAFGLYIGQQHSLHHKLFFSTFIIANWLGLIFSYQFQSEALALIFLISAGFIGALVALEKNIPAWLFTILAVILGIYTGSDSSLDGVQGNDLIIALIGCSIGVINLMLYALVSAHLGKASSGWKSILIRVLGSWIVACSALIIALSFLKTAL